MRLELRRDSQTRQGTTGHLFIDRRVDAAGAEPFCITLERPAAHFSDPHPCIPAGEYRVVLYASPHFRRLMPLVRGVPGRSGIEIHWGNYVRDFEGCIGVGAARGELPDGSPTIWNSRATFDRLFPLIEAAIARTREPTSAAEREGCTMIVRDPQLAPEAPRSSTGTELHLTQK